MNSDKTLFILFLCLLTAPVLQAQDSLSHYLELAMENNPGLKSAYEGFFAAAERSDQAGTLPDPSLGIGYFISPVETRVGPQQFRFSLTQMFPWFGTLKSKKLQSDRQAEASFWQFADRARSLTRDVRKTYYELWILHRLIDLERENLALLESTEELATTRFRSGDGRMADILRVQLDKKTSGNTIESLTDRLETTTEQFFLLLNADRSTLHLPDTIAVQLPIFSDQDSLSGHPLVQANIIRSQAAEAYAEASRKQAYPSIGVGLDYMIIGKREDMNIPDNGKNAFMPMVTIGLPIWQKKYASMRDEAEATRRQYLHAARAEQLALQSGRLENEYEIRRALEEMEIFREQTELIERVLKLTETDFANDRARFEDILEDQEKLLRYRMQFMKSYGRVLEAVANYDYLTGENPAFITELLNDENEN